MTYQLPSLKNVFFFIAIVFLAIMLYSSLQTVNFSLPVVQDDPAVDTPNPYINVW